MMMNSTMRSSLRSGRSISSTIYRSAAVASEDCALASSPQSPLLVQNNASLHNSHQQTRSFGTRGARGLGWFVQYRRGKGGRHLQGEYFDRESLEECQIWNDAIYQLGTTQVYMDIVMEPKRIDPLAKTQKLIKNKRPTYPKHFDIEKLTSTEKHRIVIDLATAVMPETTENFMQLCNLDINGYKGSRMYRFEKNVGLCGGDVLTNTGKTGLAAPYDISQIPDGPLKGKFEPLRRTIVNDPLALWHVPGTVTMLVPRVDDVDSRFVLCTERCMHMDGIHRAIGKMHPESLELVRKWQAETVTQDAGIPSSHDMIVVDAGILTPSSGTEEEAAA